MAVKVEIYSSDYCGFCRRAKALLNSKKVQYIEYCVDGDDALRKMMMERANGGRTVPQIFIDDQHIGGCDELYELESEDGLDVLLQG